MSSYHSTISAKLANLLKNGSLSYEYQKFLIVKWFFDEEISSDLITGVIRNLIGDTLYRNTKNYCIAYLGKYGEYTDLDLIESFYSDSPSDQLKATVICALRKMGRSRRNAIYGRAQGDGYLVDLAVRWALSHS